MAAEAAVAKAAVEVAAVKGAAVETAPAGRAELEILLVVGAITLAPERAKN